MPPTPEVLVLAETGRHRLTGQVRIRPTGRPYVAAPYLARDGEYSRVPVVNVARAVADTALEYRRLDPVRALTTSAIQRGLCSADDLISELDAGPRNDSAMLRKALADVLDGAHSIAEAEAAEFLRLAGVPCFELNVAVVDSRGQLLAVVDVLWRDLRAVAEIDSREYHFSERDWKRTGRRHNVLTSAGLALQHYPPSEIRADPSAWALSVAAWLRARACELGVAYVLGDGALRPGAYGAEPFVVAHSGDTSLPLR
jgi:hypothetical protein